MIGKLVILIIAIVLVVVLLSMLKEVLHITTAVLTLLIVTGLITGFFLVRDINDIRENFATSDKLFLYGSDKGIHAGFVLTGEDNINVLNNVSEANEAYTKNNWRSIYEKYYKTLIFSDFAFDEFESTPIGEDTFLNSQLKQVMTANDSLDAYAMLLMAKQNLNDEEKEELYTQLRNKFRTSDYLNSMIFSSMMQEILQKEGNKALTSRLNDDTVQSRPETISLILLKRVPFGTIEEYFEERKSSIQQKIIDLAKPMWREALEEKTAGLRESIQAGKEKLKNLQPGEVVEEDMEEETDETLTQDMELTNEVQ